MYQRTSQLRRPLGWFYLLSLVIDAGLVVCCYWSRLNGAASFYLQVGLLATLAVLGVLAIVLLLANLLRKQWERAMAWLLFMAFNFGSCWAGMVISLMVIDAPFTPDPPQTSFLLYQSPVALGQRILRKNCVF